MMDVVIMVDFEEVRPPLSDVVGTGPSVRDGLGPIACEQIEMKNRLHGRETDRRVH